MKILKYSKTCMKTSLISLLILFFSCNNGKQDMTKTDSLTDTTNSAAIRNEIMKTVHDTTNKKDKISDNENNDSTIHVRFQRDSISTTVDGRMRGFGHPVTVYIPIKQGKQFSARISSDDSTANIRINQIFTPDGKADGPFGREWKFAIRQQGMYKLLIGENLMQGDEWKGKFTLAIVVK